MTAKSILYCLCEDDYDEPDIDPAALVGDDDIDPLHHDRPPVLKPFGSVGAPIYTISKRKLICGINTAALLPRLFTDLSVSEITRRWKAGALKVNGQKRPFSREDSIYFVDIRVKEEAGKKPFAFVKITLGKEAALLTTSTSASDL
jgi:hypothetical protein